MTDPQVALFMLGIFVLAIFLGFPIAFTMMGMAILFGYFAYYEPGLIGRPPAIEFVSGSSGDDDDPHTASTVRLVADEPG